MGALAVPSPAHTHTGTHMQSHSMLAYKLQGGKLRGEVLLLVCKGRIGLWCNTIKSHTEYDTKVDFQVQRKNLSVNMWRLGGIWDGFILWAEDDDQNYWNQFQVLTRLKVLFSRSPEHVPLRVWKSWKFSSEETCCFEHAELQIWMNECTSEDPTVTMCSLLNKAQLYLSSQLSRE